MRALQILLLLILLALAGYGVTQLSTPVEQGPYVTWAAMQRLWNKMAPKGVDIVQVEPAAGGYLVIFAPGLVMNVVMKGDQVHSLRLQYDSTNDPVGAGQLFLRGATTALRVGSYSWPQALRDEAESVFASITPQKIGYSHAATHFTRQAFPTGVWEFLMEYDLGQ